MKRFFVTFVKDESGQDLVEYALLLSILAVAAVATLGTLATTISGRFTAVNNLIAPS